MTSRGTIQLGTRGSALARRQAAIVAEALSERRYDVDLVAVETTGDRLDDEAIHRLGQTGAFVRELDERVLDGDLDAAVHSLKDVPTEGPDELVTAAVAERGRSGDVLVTPDGTTLEELPEGAVVGTSSLRRRAQLLAHRPDFKVEPLRGNVDTRIEKLLAPTLQAEYGRRSEAEAERKANVGDDAFEPAFDRTVEEWFDELAEIERQALGREVETAYDAIVLAEAGIQRAGLTNHVEYERLPRRSFVPAPGQGALAVTVADGDLAEEINTAIDHPRSRVEVTAERIVLAELGGGCIAPIGVSALVQGEYVQTIVQVFDRDGEKSVTGTRDLPLESYPDAAAGFAADLADRGAATLIERARKRTGDSDDDETAGPSRLDETETEGP